MRFPELVRVTCNGTMEIRAIEKGSLWTRSGLCEASFLSVYIKIFILHVVFLVGRLDRLSQPGGVEDDKRMTTVWGTQEFHRQYPWSQHFLRTKHNFWPARNFSGSMEDKH